MLFDESLSGPLRGAGVGSRSLNLLGGPSWACHLRHLRNPPLGWRCPGFVQIARTVCGDLQPCDSERILWAVDLSTDGRVQIDCELCGRPFDSYDVTDDPRDGFTIHEVEREPLAVLGYVLPAHVDRPRGLRGRPTGRHRMRKVDGRDGVAYRFECGCGHSRIIGPGALRRKIVAAPEPPIRL